ASLGLRAAAYDINQFPWFAIPILLIVALLLSIVGAYQFSHQQD
ncbi:MAG: ABC transporter permease, partial [Microcystis sp.]